MADEDMEVDAPAPEELLVTRRSRRSTAGNRMQAAMAEMELDDSLKDGDDDADYANDKDEEDVFDADFESTDEEAQDEEMTGEMAAQEEEKRARKATRSRLEKATDAAHARNKATFDPQAIAIPSSKRRVALGGAVNAATGEAIAERSGDQRPTAHRQSMRKHTILNTSLTETRLKRSEEKKAAQVPKKPRREVRTLSQTELIARALDAEEGNIVEHRDYLKVEEEKRRRARVVRPVVQGPLLRWVSRVEEVKVPIPPPLVYNYGYTGGTSGGFIFPSYQPVGAAGGTLNTLPTSTSNTPVNSNPAAQTYIPSTSFTNNPLNAYIPSHPSYLPAAGPYIPPIPATRTEKVARNYVVHEEAQGPEIPPSNTLPGRSTSNRSQNTNIPKPAWGSTMTALFGSHVNWEEVKVYAGKGRPMSKSNCFIPGSLDIVLLNSSHCTLYLLAILLGRPIQTCPLTGRAARYRDPRTGVPFADVGAFETLTRVLNHEYVWTPEIGAYVRQEAPVAKLVAAEDPE
ncbi:YL1 nuclear protein-domain-containing protein [Mycena epipterygia]|nr:YL1 nuclear protein-domain-containing protein [Mycena epipterygia]